MSQDAVRQSRMSKDQREQLRRKIAQERQQAIQSWNAPTEALRQQTKSATQTVVRRRSWKSVEQVKQEYIDGEIEDHELDDALERAMKTKDQTADEEKIQMFVNAAQQPYQNRDAVSGFLVVLGIVWLFLFLLLVLLL